MQPNIHSYAQLHTIIQPEPEQLAIKQPQS